MAKEAYPFLIPLALSTVFSFWFGPKWGAFLFLALTLFVGFFFRDPDRSIPAEEAVVVSPADGKVVKISGESDGTTRVSIFLSIFNVHVNRSPIAGKIESIRYVPGKFKVAFDDGASVENEQNVWVIDNDCQKVRFSQIAGILARRIVCWKKAGDNVGKGERIGLIKFGSRVDIFLPENVRLEVTLGDKVKGGNSVIGRFSHV